MNKVELIEKVANHTELTKRTSRQVVDGVVSVTCPPRIGPVIMLD